MIQLHRLEGFVRREAQFLPNEVEYNGKPKKISLT